MTEQMLSMVRGRELLLKSVIVLAIALGLTFLPPASTLAGSGHEHKKEKKSDENEVKNFGKVNDHLFRGGQPDDTDYQTLASMGIKTIIDLREDAKFDSRELAEKAGLKYLTIPLNAKRPPTLIESNRFLSLVDDQENWPVYVHCAGGRHRTGVLVAVYRMERDGWNAERAFQEMKDYKFYSRFGHGGMKDYVYDYYRRHLNEAKAKTESIANKTLPAIGLTTQ